MSRQSPINSEKYLAIPRNAIKQWAIWQYGNLTKQPAVLWTPFFQSWFNLLLWSNPFILIKNNFYRDIKLNCSGRGNVLNHCDIKSNQPEEVFTILQTLRWAQGIRSYDTLEKGLMGLLQKRWIPKREKYEKLRWFYCVECCIWISLCQCIALMQERKSCNQEDFAVWAPDLLSGKNQTCCQVKRRSMPFLPIRKILLFRILNIQHCFCNEYCVA